MPTITGTPTTDSAVWQARAQALDKLIRDTVASFTDHTSAQQNEFRELLTFLPHLQREMIATFEEGFRHNKFETSDDYPPDYVYDQLLAQVATDLNAIVQIEGQRRRVDGLATDHPERVTLMRADQLAHAALAPARAAHWITDATWPICYYQKSASIRLIPYRNVALVALPYTATQVSRDFLAIPHEVGHYLYWRGTLNERPIRTVLRTQFSASAPWVKNWLEEIFADVYGAWLAGPAIALSFQDLQRSAGKTFLKDDGDHPAPILRPVIYTKVLQRYYPEWADPLAAHWQKFVAGRPTHFLVEDGARKKMLIDEAITLGGAGSGHLDGVIDWLLEQFAQLEPNLAWRSYLTQLPSGETVPVEAAPTEATATEAANATGGDSGQLVYTLYGAFDAAVASPDLFPPADRPNTPARSEVQPTPAELIKRWESDLVEDQEPSWLPLLRAGGWTSKGPHGRH